MTTLSISLSLFLPLACTGVGTPPHISRGHKRTRERAGWLLRDSLTTLALILAEKEEVSRLERAMDATWLDLESDRRERFEIKLRLYVLLYVFHHVRRESWRLNCKQVRKKRGVHAAPFSRIRIPCGSDGQQDHAKEATTVTVRVTP